MDLDWLNQLQKQDETKTKEVSPKQAANDDFFAQLTSPTAVKPAPKEEAKTQDWGVNLKDLAPAFGETKPAPEQELE